MAGGSAAEAVQADAGELPVAAAAVAFRRGGPATVAAALTDTRAHTLRAFDAYRRALPDLRVPQRGELNLPLWELGHIGWFQEFWTLRNPQWRRGWQAQPGAPRAPALRAGADRLYDSSRVAHPSRWSLELPDAQATLNELAQQLEATLALLASAADDDASLYFFRLSVLHEDMHREAAVYMAQSLGIAFDALPAATAPEPAPEPAPSAAPRAADLRFDAMRIMLGSDGGGFAFDNELCAHELTLDAFCIDAQVRRWRDVLPFIAAGGYADEALWTEAGNAWRRATGAQAPRHLRLTDDGWQACRFGRWQPLDLDAPACHPARRSAGARCGSGPPARSRRTPASSRIRTATTRRPGSARGACCAARHPPRRRACGIRATAISSPPSATTSSPACAAAPASCGRGARLRCGATPRPAGRAGTAA